MSKKDIIETNKLFVGTGGTMNGLFIGSSTAESRYAVLTDENAQKTVIYDKVQYEFGVNNISGTVPANGGTYNITASVSKKTHGDGSVENNIPFSPTSITVPANTGSSYNSAITITQSVSQLTGSCAFSVEADSVTSLTLTLNVPDVIPASGGSVNSTTYTLKANYKSGRVVNNVTTGSLEWTGVTADSKGTTISNQTNAGTLYAKATFSGKTATANIQVNQAANAITGYTEYSAPYGGTFSASVIPASGGTSTVTSNTSGVKQTRKAVYSSTATAETATEFTPSSITTGVTGNGEVVSKGSVTSNTTTAKTLTCWYAANSKTATTTIYATQEGNYINDTATGSSISAWTSGYSYTASVSASNYTTLANAAPPYSTTVNVWFRAHHTACSCNIYRLTYTYTSTATSTGQSQTFKGAGSTVYDNSTLQLNTTTDISPTATQSGTASSAGKTVTYTMANFYTPNSSRSWTLTAQNSSQTTATATVTIYQKDTSCYWDCTCDCQNYCISDGSGNYCSCNGQCNCDAEKCSQCTCHAVECSQCTCHQQTCSQCSAQCTCDDDSCTYQCNCDAVSCNQCTCHAVECSQCSSHGTCSQCTCDLDTCAVCSCDDKQCSQCTCHAIVCGQCTSDGGCDNDCTCYSVCSQTYCEADPCWAYICSAM